MFTAHKKWWSKIVLCITIGLPGCMPWRSQGEAQISLETDLRDWEEFFERDTSGSFESLKSGLLHNGPDLEAFMGPGPISYKVHENRLARWKDKSHLVYDNLVPRSASPTPVVILVHGNHSHKEAHRYQAERLASFGIHTIVLQVPNQGQWVLNGELIRKFVARVRRRPDTFGGRIDKNNIILAGHSFGGSAVTVATGLGAKVRGVVLLDPAVVSDSVLHYMKSVRHPTLLLGADEKIFRARRQGEFERNIGGDFISISIKGATHDDAQFPSMYSHAAFGYDPFTSPEKQKVFAAALTVGAFSLGATGRLHFATEAMVPLVEEGELLYVKTRPASKTELASPRHW